LVEVLVVMTISAILLAIAMPSFQSLIRSNRISNAANTLVAAFDLTRSEAVRRASTVVICRSADATVQVPNCSSAQAGVFPGDDWASGWIAFAKAPGNGNNAVFEPNDELLLRQEAPPVSPGERLIIQSTLPNSQRREFNARGLTMGGGLFGISLIVDYRDPQVAQPTNLGRCVVLNSSGRTRAARLVNGFCPQA